MVEDPSEYDEIVDFVFDIEAELDLFDWTIDGIHIWEYIRFKYYRRVLMESGLFDQPHTNVENVLANYARGMYLWGRNLAIENPYFDDQHDVVTLNNSRRKLGDDDTWWDIHFDPLYETGELDYLHLERPYLNEHRTPARTGNISYLDFIEYTAHICRALGLVEANLTDKDESIIAELRDRADRRFGASVDMESYIRTRIQDEKATKPLYDRLLRRLDPKVVLLICSYGKETEIKSCKQNGIPVVELQHGGFTPDHMGFSFPGDRTKSLFPDYLFLFGERWRENVEFAIPDDHVVTVGFPYLEDEVKKYQHLDKRDQIIIISQGPKGEHLSKFAIDVATDDRVDYDVVYKLHPGEYDRWKSEYPWLDDTEITVLDDDSVPLYRLLSESKVQVGVNSTVIYEGLNFGLDTYLLQAPGVAPMEWIADMDCVSVVDSADQFANGFDPDHYDIDTHQFFEPNAKENMVDAIERIIAGGL